MGMRLGGKRRGRDTGFQWLMIGIVLGMGCAFSFGLALYVFEIIEVSIDDEPPPTEVVFVTLESSGETGPETTTEATLEPTVDMTTPDTVVDEGDVTADVTGSEEPPAVSSPAPTALPGGPTATATIGISVNPPGGVDDTSTQATPTTDPGVPVVSISPELSAIRTELVLVDGGTFRMGTTQDEGSAAVADCVSRDTGTCQPDWVADSIPAHDVYVDSFQIEKYEVTVAQYVAFLNYLVDQSPGTRPHLTACNGGPCVLTITDTGGENSDISFNGERYEIRAAVVDRSNYPVTFVFWQGAGTYCETIGRNLPSEAQWERAARGPQNWIYPWGQQWDVNRANTSRYPPSPRATLEVTALAAEGASAWGGGVVNMSGNAAEWTNDYYSATLYQTRASSGQVEPNPTGPGGGDSVVVRGGSWDTVPLFARAVHRRDLSPSNPNPAVGFRCAADVTAS